MDIRHHLRQGLEYRNIKPYVLQKSLTTTVGTEQKIQAHGDADGQNRKNELPHGQSEKHGFRIAADLPVDFYFQ